MTDLSDFRRTDDRRSRRRWWRGRHRPTPYGYEPLAPAQPAQPTDSIPPAPARPVDPPRSPAPPAPPAGTTTASGATRGQTVNYNQGHPGSCVQYVLDRFKALTGVYPRTFGDALQMAAGAAVSGWTVSNTPRVDSIAIFQPGQNGAGAGTGHAAWVEQVTADGRIFVREMNAPNPFIVSSRWCTPVRGVQYIYA